METPSGFVQVGVGQKTIITDDDPSPSPVDRIMIVQVKKDKPRRRDPTEPLRGSQDDHVALMFRAATGDETAYAEIYRRYSPAVLRFFLSLNGHSSQHDLDDMTQEVFHRGWDKRKEFQGKSSVKTYLLGFAKYVCREHGNRHIREDSKQQRIIQNGCRIDTAPPPEEALCHRESILKLRKAIEKLSKKQQRVLNIILEDRDISMAEAARRAGLCESAYRKMFSIAKKHLRDACDVEDFT